MLLAIALPVPRLAHADFWLLL
ncbi:hypothetical protein MPL3356_150324 [Mesorhizobium plurifarium]|uniref:Uncharacterized protein n=1 Tax=Mesorhizobium plurifarium TaxID=69974 RepID=A0A090DKE8_MESPL|nr:hypothetical protein MPL3356_150324 [Mesorhizobium plurifarium]